MPLKNQTPPTSIGGAGSSVIIFPGRKASLSKISPLPPSSKAHLAAALESRTAFRRLIAAAEHFAYEPGEQSYQDFEATKDMVVSLLDGGDDDAA